MNRLTESGREAGPAAARAIQGRLTRWFYKGYEEPEGPHARPTHTAPWWKVMCLTGVDYFSTLAYQASIAFLAAGVLSPIATFVLIVLTLFGALPMYSRIAEMSPHGQGSILILEDLFPKWKGKVFVLCLLGFAATDFVITITLSAADATAHLLENPLTPSWLDHPLLVTLALLLCWARCSCAGFARRSRSRSCSSPRTCRSTSSSSSSACARSGCTRSCSPAGRRRSSAQHGNPLMMLAMAAILFPKLALGLSGFETGVAVMPLVQRRSHRHARKRRLGRIRHTKKLLRTAALIMSVMLMGSSLATAVLIPADAFLPGHPADGRALAYLAHELIGTGFGTLYDAATVAILWFAGASAMAGLLNLVPRYLPRYGMAPEWARATRPLVVIFTGITVLVTIIFDADVDAQGGAYATGVLVLMSSAALAVALTAWRQRRHWIPFGLISLVFIYTTVVNIIERPEGIKIASFFILTIIVTSLVSRALRSTELRVHGFRPDEAASEFIADSARRGEGVRIIASRPRSGLLRSTRTSCARRPTRTGCRRTIRCCFWRFARGRLAVQPDPRRRGRAGRTASDPPVREPGHSECDRRAAALYPGPDRSDSPRLFRLDGRQSDHLPAQVPGVRRGRHRAGDP